MPSPAAVAAARVRIAVPRAGKGGSRSPNVEVTMAATASTAPTAKFRYRLYRTAL